MTTRVATAGTFTNTTLAAADLNDMPGGRIAYLTLTANTSTFTGSVVDIAGLSHTITAAGNRLLVLTVDVQVQSTVAGDQIRVFIKDGTDNQLTYVDVTCVTANDDYLGFRTVQVQPSSGSVTYKISARRNSGTGNCIIAAGATIPVGFYIDDVGPSF